jgi:hypothetical protein
MDVFELTHKVSGKNAGGAKVDTGVVGRDGKTWSIQEASQIIIRGQAKFLHAGKEGTDLDMLPEKPGAL